MADYRKIWKFPTALKVVIGAMLISGLLTVPAVAALIGPTLPNSVGSPGSVPQGTNITFVQTALSVPGTTVSAPSAGTITGFNMRIGTVTNASSTLQFWVLRPIAGGFSPVASTAAVLIQANTLNQVAANIPVIAGDHIGISEPAGNNFETPAMNYLGGTISYFLTIPTVGVPLTGGTSQSNSVNRFNADFTPASSGTAPTTPTPDTTAPTIDLTTPGSKSTYRRLKNISLTTEASASVELALLKCLGGKCPKSVKAAKKSKKKGKCRALVSKKAKKRKTFLTFGGKNISCKFNKIKSKSKVMHAVSLSSSGKGTFKLAGKLRGKRNKKGLAIPGRYVLYVQATDAAGNSDVVTKKFRIKGSKKSKRK